MSPDLVDLLEHLLKKTPNERLTLEGALDHSWCQLADDEAMADMDVSVTQHGAAPMGRSLRARAMSFSQVYVTQEDINAAIRSVNNFVLVVRGGGVGAHTWTDATDATRSLALPSVVRS